jgi:hypothetical protein
MLPVGSVQEYLPQQVSDEVRPRPSHGLKGWDMPARATHGLFISYSGPKAEDVSGVLRLEGFSYICSSLG